MAVGGTDVAVGGAGVGVGWTGVAVAAGVAEGWGVSVAVGAGVGADVGVGMGLAVGSTAAAGLAVTGAPPQAGSSTRRDATLRIRRKRIATSSSLGNAVARVRRHYPLSWARCQHTSPDRAPAPRDRREMSAP